MKKEKKILVAVSLLFAASAVFVFLNALNVKLGFAGGCSGCPDCLCECNTVNPWTVGLCGEGEVCNGEGDCLDCVSLGCGDHFGACKNTINCGDCNTPPAASFIVVSDPIYVRNLTSIDSCGLALQNTSTDEEDCPGGRPCDPGFLSCLWEIDSGDPSNSSCGNVTFSDLMVGDHTVDLMVIDQEGLSDSATQETVTLKKDVYANFECSLDAGVTWEDCDDLVANPEAGDTINFRAVNGENLSTPSDAIGGETVSIDNYKWDLDGDGGFDLDGDQSTSDYIYADADSYEVTLMITDSAGRRAERKHTITVDALADLSPEWMEISL